MVSHHSSHLSIPCTDNVFCGRDSSRAFAKMSVKVSVTQLPYPDKYDGSTHQSTRQKIVFAILTIWRRSG
jgi:hypothetical protein